MDAIKVQRPRRVRVSAEIAEEQLAEFDLLMAELVAGARPRVEALETKREEIRTRALKALQRILAVVRAHPGTGQSRYLVHFLAGLWNGSDYPFDLSDLRTLDTALGNACLDYLNYDRLGICDLERHLPDGGRELQGWLKRYAIRAVRR